MPVIATLFRYKWMILLVTALCAGGTAVGVRMTKDVYRAKGTLLLKLGREFMYRPEVGGLEARDMFRLEEMMNSEAEILESTDLARSVVEEMGVARIYPELVDEIVDVAYRFEVGVAKFASATTVRSIEDSSILKVSFEHEDPETSSEALNRLLDAFLVRHTELFGDASSEFLEEHHRQAARQVAEATEALRAFKAEQGIVDVTHQLQLLLTQLAELEARANSITTRREEVARAVEALDADEPGGAGTGLVVQLDLGEPVNKALEERLRITLLLQELAVNYDPDSRRLRGVRGELEAVEALIHEAVYSTEATLAERAAAMAAQRAALETKLDDMNDASRELQSLERDLVGAEGRLASARAHLADAQLSKQLDDERLISVKVVDRARPPLEPSGLSRKMRLILGTFAGFAFAIALVFAREAAAPVD